MNALPPHETMPDPSKLSHETLREYFANPYRYAQQLGEDGKFLMVVDSSEHRIRFEAPADGSVSSEVLQLRNLTLDHDEDHGYYVLVVETGDYPEAAYSLAYAVYQGMTAGRSFQVSLNAAVESFKELLARKRRLSDEQVAGLVGELLLLDHLMDVTGVEDALTAWIGPRGEEHDFGLASVDLEVKTTLSERRRHMINGADQLLPRADRDLWLVSVQLTRVGSGQGVSLDQLCETLMGRAGGRSPELRKLLSDVGWIRDDRGLYGERFDFRNRPRAIHVDDTFPALTTPRIAENVPSSALLSDIAYRVDVSGLLHGVPHPHLEDFVERN